MLEEAGYCRHDLGCFLLRTVFCLFADNVGVFESRGVFRDLVEVRTSEDGTNLGHWLAHVFQTLGTPKDQRLKTLHGGLAQLPYVNVPLFQEPLRIAAFDAAMSSVLLDACRLDWSNISPAIFGELFQSVLDPVQRRTQGVHYTAENDIFKVIEPLFLDDLRAEFERLKLRRGSGRRAALKQFQQKLGALRFFDPACGCGDFLLITYRELRLLEIEVLKELETQATLDVGWTLSMVGLDQLYGIEVGKLSARSAEAALWMMDHTMNNRLSLEFGQSDAHIPPEKLPHIFHGDALQIDWTEVLPPQACSYVLGNPPFVGAKYQTEKQRRQVRKIAKLDNSGGTLDFVAAWFIKAGEYIESGSACIGFVATNSITQGEQVAQLWPVLFNRHNLEIAFAHRTFAWGSDARGKAHVHVVIIGLDHQERARKTKTLFSYPRSSNDPEKTQHAFVSPYLLDAKTRSQACLTVRESSRPLNGMKPMIIGSQPIDRGHYIFTATKRAAFLETEPEAAPLLRPFVGAREFLQGGQRWILALHEVSPAVLARLPEVHKRIAAVRTFRQRSRRRSTQKLAETPNLYQVNVLPDAPFLVIPETSSKRRKYVPIGWLKPPTIPSNSTKVILGADAIDFALLTSAMHMAWLRAVGGR